MAGTRRTPISRPPRPILDAESVRLFKRGVKLAGDGLDDTEEFRKVSVLLHRRLALKPWVPSVFDMTMDDAPPDSPYEFKLWKTVMDLRRQLILLT